MKIVAIKTIKMKIDSYIDDLSKKGIRIARIELSSEEFLDMLECVKGTKDVGKTHFEWSRGRGVKAGSYFVYKGICVQHHSSYKSGDLGVEYLYGEIVK